MEGHSASTVTDPSDFAGTSLAPLASVDGLLRCQICKDFYTNAVITSCFHTFCSLCIRRCLAVDGRCPTCRTSEQESKLRRNVVVQEVVDAFASAREGVLNFARQAVESQSSKQATTAGDRSSKRKRHAEQEDEDRPAQTPRTRSQRKNAEHPNNGFSQSAAPNGGAIVIDDSDQDYAPTSSPIDGGDGASSPGPVEDAESSDGLVPCPICDTRMKAEAVFTHLDNCDGQKKRSPSSSDRRGFLQTQRGTKPTPPPERLPQLNYSLFKETALRKKLQELGIPNWGAKPLLVKRHTEWINLWNSNCDSSRPRSRRELLSELDAWEKSQGGHARSAISAGDAGGGFVGANGVVGGGSGAAVMKKDFDGQAWARRNKDDFDALIARARKGRSKPEEAKPAEDASNEPRKASLDSASIKSAPSIVQHRFEVPEVPFSPSLSSHSSSMAAALAPPLNNSQRRNSSPVPGFSSTLDPNSPSMLAETRGRRMSVVAATAPSPTSNHVSKLRKSNSSLPDRMFATLGGKVDESEDEVTADDDSTKRKPMFEVPSGQIMEADVGGVR